MPEGKCLDRPPCLGCERALDELRDGRLPKLSPQCSQLKARARLDCLFRVADTLPAEESSLARGQRPCQRHRGCWTRAKWHLLLRTKVVLLRGDRVVQRLCPASCGMCSNLASGAQASDTQEAALWIGYLHSHQHMGRGAVACDGSCSCDAVIDAHNSLLVTAAQ